MAAAVAKTEAIRTWEDHTWLNEKLLATFKTDEKNGMS
jgi:hypothetical protein